MDSKVIFEMIFGSEKFEPILGELQISQMMNMKEDQPEQILEFHQKKREVQLAVNLIETLQLFMDDKMEEFEAANEAMAKELASNSMGKAMLGKIAYIYIETGTLHIGGLKSIIPHFNKMGHNWEAKVSLMKSMYSTFKAAKKMEEQRHEEFMRKSEEEKKQEEEKKEPTEKDIENMKKISENMVDVAWSMTVLDIEQTLRAAIQKLFRDTDVDKGLKAKRALALIKLGQIYEKYGDKTG